MLRLHVQDYQSPHSWNWVLTDVDGQVIGEHRVRLAPSSLINSRVLDLYQSLWRIDTDPTRQAASAQSLRDRAGQFIATHIWGELAATIVDRAPTTVQMVVPPSAVDLLRIPFELAQSAGAALGLSGVTICYTPTESSPPPHASGEPLRMLALFALPVDSSALALARERRLLAQQMSAFGGLVDLHVLQYGVTREVVRRALDHPEGWDIVHVAGHGTAGVLHLENQDGSRDPVPAMDIVTRLAVGAGRTRLVVLSACESGTARAARRALRAGRSIQSLAKAVRLDTQLPMTGPLPSLGYEVARELGCAVLAMRYPVDDDFSVAFSQHVYQALLERGRPLDTAVREALLPAVRQAPQAPLAVATPIVFSGTVPHLELFRALGRPARRSARVRHVPAEPPLFVGRTELMRALNDFLAAADDRPAMAIIGMPGIGKTSTLSEWLHLNEKAFDLVVWHDVTVGQSAEEIRAALRGAMDGAVDHDLTAGSRARGTVLVIDDAHAGLAPNGEWRDKDIAELMLTLSASGAGTKVLFASDRSLPLPAHVDQLLVPLLSRSEAELLGRQVEEQNWTEVLSVRPAPNGLPWLVCRGHPGLIIYTGTGSPVGVIRRTDRISRAWGILAPSATRTSLSRSHPGRAITAWAAERAGELAPPADRLWQFLSCLEASDRNAGLVTNLWPMVADDATDAPADEAISAIMSAGLIQPWSADRYLMHPGVAVSGRLAATDLERRTIRLLAKWWSYAHELGTRSHAGEDVLAGFAASAIPYLMRAGRWEEASARAERAIHHDMSPPMAARLIPFCNEIVRATSGTDLGRATRYVRAIVLLHLDHNRGIAELRRVLAAAQAASDPITVVGAASALATELENTDPSEARHLLEDVTEAGTTASLGAWSTLLLRLKATRQLARLGDPEKWRQEAESLVAALEDPELAADPHPAVNPFSVRIEVLEVAAAAESRGGQYTREADLRRRILAETLQSGASDRDIARAQFNLLSMQLGRGSWDTTTEDLLLAARAQFDNPADAGRVSLVLMELAQLQRRQGNNDDAVDLARQAVRADYNAPDLLGAAEDHHSLATLLTTRGRPEDTQETPLHILAAAVIRTRLSEGSFVVTSEPATFRALAMVTFTLARNRGALPDSFPELRGRLREVMDVDIDALLAHTRRTPIVLDAESGDVTVTFLPDGSGEPAGDSVTDVLCWAEHRPPPAELLAAGADQRHWVEIVAAVTNAVRTRSREEVEPVLDSLRVTGWTALAHAFESLVLGTDPTSALSRLDSTDAAIVGRVMANLG